MSSSKRISTRSRLLESELHGSSWESQSRRNPTACKRKSPKRSERDIASESRVELRGLKRKGSGMLKKKGRVERVFIRTRPPVPKGKGVQDAERRSLQGRDRALKCEARWIRLYCFPRIENKSATVGRPRSRIYGARTTESQTTEYPRSGRSHEANDARIVGY